MNAKNKKLAAGVYFASSLLVIALWTLFTYGPFWHRDLLDLSQQQIPLKWYEYVNGYLGCLFVPALYGLFSFLLIHRAHKKEAVGGYFIIALVIGVVFVFNGWFSGVLGRLDCAGHCTAYIPSSRASTITTLLALPPLVIAPAIYIYASFRPSKVNR